MRHLDRVKFYKVHIEMCIFNTADIVLQIVSFLAVNMKTLFIKAQFPLFTCRYGVAAMIKEFAQRRRGTCSSRLFSIYRVQALINEQT